MEKQKRPTTYGQVFLDGALRDVEPKCYQEGDPCPVCPSGPRAIRLGSLIRTGNSLTCSGLRESSFGEATYPFPFPCQAQIRPVPCPSCSSGTLVERQTHQNGLACVFLGCSNFHQTGCRAAIFPNVSPTAPARIRLDDGERKKH